MVVINKNFNMDNIKVFNSLNFIKNNQLFIKAFIKNNQLIIKVFIKNNQFIIKAFINNNQDTFNLDNSSNMKNKFMSILFFNYFIMFKIFIYIFINQYFLLIQPFNNVDFHLIFLILHLK